MRLVEATFMRTLRHLYDAEHHIAGSVPDLLALNLGRGLSLALTEIAECSKAQAQRLEQVFAALYLKPRREAAWPAIALLNEAEQAASGDEPCVEGCAAALLALKRYELSLYEGLYFWSSECGLNEVLGDLRRSIAEEMLHASVLADLAFQPALKSYGRVQISPPAEAR